ncbi:hypothetical protein N9137_02095 [Pseudomonadales bacterium]|nr:hypothetical protein [Pseudomonadales bacterium]
MKKDIEQKDKLTSEIEKESRNRKTFFFALWLLNAVTTFVFGMEYIDGLYIGLIEPLRMGDYGTLVFSQILGGLSALLVLDIAYKKWGQIAKTSTTNIQLRSAKFAGDVSFYLSLTFSAIVFITKIFNSLVTTDLVQTLDTVGAVSFVGAIIIHLVCWRTFSEGGATEIELADSLKFEANNHTEALAIKRNSQSKSLIKARKEMDRLEAVIAAAQSETIVAEMIRDILGEDAINNLIIDGELVSAESIPPTAPTVAPIGFGSKAAQSDVSKAELARRAIVAFVGDTPMRYTDIVSTCTDDGHNPHTVKRAITELTSKGTLENTPEGYIVS